ncbi:MAG: homocysteine S-methyltransferase family protein [Oscillospiraceae bacterium]|nr:homocysteine S-methyltransferase family protein [Oscillospiraceae bacterium]
MGTMLQQGGLCAGENPVAANITRPELVESIHRAYVEAGSDIILTNTFGASRKKLLDTDYTPAEVIGAAVRVARRAADDRAKVALDIGPLGELLSPLGTLTFDEAYDLFREQIEAGAEAGADLVFIETMTDLQEVRAALLAVKECSDLPVFVTMSFEPSGRTFTGVLPESFAIVATGLGADAIGVNCSMGPDQMVDVVDRILRHTDLPVIVKPNAGLPDPFTGAYDMAADVFAESIEVLAAMGASILGGCCGTSPAYIEGLRAHFANDTRPKLGKRPRQSLVCSASKLVVIDGVRVIGERINPTGKPEFRRALGEGNLDYILEQAISQETAGADLLDVNVGLPGLDEPRTMADVVNAIQAVTGLPLQVDSSDPAALEAGLRAFCGKAIVNSVNGDAAVLDRVLPLVKKYGAAVVGLTLDEAGLAETAERKLAIARRILDAAIAHGIPKEDVYIDCLTLTVSAQPEGAVQTLRAVRTVREELGLQTVLGVSNISFGLPNRELVNQTFLTAALEAGLTLPILNPNSRLMMDAVSAFRLLHGADPDGAGFIARFADASEREAVPSATTGTPIGDIGQAIARGLKEDARRITAELMQAMPEMAVVQEHLIPALDSVGRQFEAGTLFLPQLLNAASAAGEAFEVVKQRLAQNGGATIDKGTIVLATVRGDIHDIGKNIVKVILENYGYRVIDLGRDVLPKRVVEAVLKEQVKLVGLSALMTTTLGGMAETIRALRASGHACKIMVGGAVLTADYAAEIGADYYAKDANEGVAIAREVFGE